MKNKKRRNYMGGVYKSKSIKKELKAWNSTKQEKFKKNQLEFLINK